MGHRDISFASSSRWFSGSANIKTFALEELLGTKLRALYQRRKGRDLFDLYVALSNNAEISTDDIVRCFAEYVKHSDQSISQREFQINLEKKMALKEFRDDINILLSQQESPFDAHAAYELVTKELLEKI